MELKKEYIDEKTEIAYTLKGNYYFPNLSITKDRNFTIGRYGKARLRYRYRNSYPRSKSWYRQ